MGNSFFQFPESVEFLEGNLRKKTDRQNYCCNFAKFEPIKLPALSEHEVGMQGALSLLEGHFASLTESIYKDSI